MSLGLFVAGVAAQVSNVPGAGWLTAGAGFVGLVAIGQMVRLIAKTESQKTEVIDALEEQLREAREENKELRRELTQTILRSDVDPET